MEPVEGGGGGNGNGGRSGFYGGGVGVHVPGAAPGDMDNVGRGTSGGDRVHGPGQSDQPEVQVRVPAEDTISTVGRVREYISNIHTSLEGAFFGLVPRWVFEFGVSTIL